MSAIMKFDLLKTTAFSGTMSRLTPTAYSVLPEFRESIDQLDRKIKS